MADLTLDDLIVGLARSAERAERRLHDAWRPGEGSRLHVHHVEFEVVYSRAESGAVSVGARPARGARRLRFLLGDEPAPGRGTA
ncbi:hypothetical protein BTM25_10070 [Actinomadura rubteroloni]|uniref:Uncharacterized protein n=1 Tax=Actinomadura rubteroloni TaxID=1926885 RepID=A0A2P4UNJ6_9ACTN|nr:hypothetical protein BTM25_10070 [Actinomadura rubteroloni]